MNSPDLRVAPCTAHLTTKNPEEVLDVVADALADALSVDRHVVDRELTRRENLASTGLEQGVAVPHCGLQDAPGFAVGIVTTEHPVEFGALDGGPSDIFAFVAGPEAGRTAHVRILAAMTAELREESLRAAIRAAETGRALEQIVSDHFIPEEHEDADRFTMLMVYVQDPDLFEPILEALSAETDASVAVTSMQTAGSILHRLPLFATFWNDSEAREIQRIEVILPQDRTNRAIRRVEELADGRRGVQISAMELSYGSGVLDL